MRATTSSHSTLGTLWIIYGIICLAKAAWIVVYSATLTLMWGAVINRVADPFFWMSAFHVWLIGAVIVLVLAGIFSFLATASLFGSRATGNPLSLIACVLAILTGPLGIVLGTYTMIVTLPRSAASPRADLASAA
jgi:hypothetical protein